MCAIHCTGNSVLGGWGDTKSVLRSGFQQPTDAQNENTPGIVSPAHYTPFTVRLMRNGTLSVYANDQATPFLSHDYANPINVQYIGF